MNTNQEQSEALRLADALNSLCPLGWVVDPHLVPNPVDAAIELRRQHEEIQRLKAERDRLLDALRAAHDSLAYIANTPLRPMGRWQHSAIAARNAANAAIAAVENKA